MAKLEKNPGIIEGIVLPDNGQRAAVRPPTSMPKKAPFAVTRFE